MKLGNSKIREIGILTAMLAAGSLSSGILPAAEIHLTNGDKISGEIVTQNADKLLVRGEAYGEISVNRKFVKEIKDAIAPKPVTPRPPEPKIWDGNLSAGIDRQSGNVRSTEANAGFLIHRKREKVDEFHLKGESFYSAVNKKMNAQRYSGMIRYAFSFGKKKKWYNFYKTEADHDRFANIEYRLVPSTGLGYWFSDTPGWKAMTEAGIGFSSTKFRDQSKRRQEMVLIPRVFLEKTLFEKLKISEDLFLYPSLTERGEWRLTSETAFETPLTDALALRFSFKTLYNSRPGTGTKKRDTRLITSLVYTF